MAGVLAASERSGRLLFHYLDLLGYAFPFAWTFGRAGCFLAHDHRGVFTAHVLGVRFPEGTRFDLGLLEMLFSICVAAVFLRLGARPRHRAFFFGLILALYGPYRLFQDTLNVLPVTMGQSPDQWFALAATAGGVTVLWSTRRAGVTSRATACL